MKPINIQQQSGLISELKAMQYMIRLGYVVFVPLCTSPKCDFLAMSGEDILKVQVKTATWSTTGPHKYLQCRLSNRNKNPNPIYKKGDFDICIFVDNSRLWYVPFDEIEGMTSVCLDSNNPDYKPSKGYDPNAWLTELY